MLMIFHRPQDEYRRRQYAAPTYGARPFTHQRPGRLTALISSPGAGRRASHGHRRLCFGQAHGISQEDGDTAEYFAGRLALRLLHQPPLAPRPSHEFLSTRAVKADYRQFRRLFSAII